MLAFADGADGPDTSFACTGIIILVIFGFCYSWWRHYGSGRRVKDDPRGFEVKPITGEQARADTKEEDDHG